MLCFKFTSMHTYLHLYICLFYRLFLNYNNDCLKTVATQLCTQLSNIHVCLQITAKELNFRHWYARRVDKLAKDENDDLFPPRFKLKVKRNDTSELNLVYNILIKSKKEKDQCLTLNISVPRHQVLKAGLQILNTYICDRAWENRSYLHVKFDLIL